MSRRRSVPKANDIKRRAKKTEGDRGDGSVEDLVEEAKGKVQDAVDAVKDKLHPG